MLDRSFALPYLSASRDFPLLDYLVSGYEVHLVVQIDARTNMIGFSTPAD